MANELTKIPKFRRCVLQNFPFIEQDFDALTDYQLLCKVVEYLNKVIEHQNALDDNYTELVTMYNNLVDFVNNYFDNLDVQEEINNKLDQMAQDGSLTALIKSYIDPYIVEQNLAIESIDDKVDTVSQNVNTQLINMHNLLDSINNITPLIASSTSEMTDTSRIYVNTTDGYWYYYDGDSWEQGGLYQSEVVATDKTLTQENVPADSYTTGKYIFSLATYNALELVDASKATSGKYINPSSGALANNSGYSATDFIPVTASTQYHLLANKQVYGAYYTSADESSFISGISFNTQLPTDTTLTTPATAQYIRLSCNTLNLDEMSLKLKVNYPILLKNDVFINKANVVDPISYHTITVKPNGGGDYTTIKAAFESINDSSATNHYIVEFYGDGTEYDVTSEFDTISGSIGLRVPPFTDFVGIGGSRKNILVARLNEMNNNFSTLNLYQTSNLKGFTIKGYNTRYAVHDDFFVSAEAGKDRTVEDVIAISEKTYYFRAWGAGVRSGMNWTFKDCIFSGNQELNEGSYSCHNNTSFTAPANLTFINCRCNSKYSNGTISWGMRFSSLINNANGVINNINVIGTKMQALLFSEENASIYGSGMLWYCTGYANDIDTGTIINTDGNNYSDRINLI